MTEYEFDPSYGWIEASQMTVGFDDDLGITDLSEYQRYSAKLVQLNDQIKGMELGLAKLDRTGRRAAQPILDILRGEKERVEQALNRFDGRMHVPFGQHAQIPQPSPNLLNKDALKTTALEELHNKIREVEHMLLQEQKECKHAEACGVPYNKANLMRLQHRQRVLLARLDNLTNHPTPL